MSKSKKYKIAVIGPIPRDFIITYRGQEIRKYGCITHPVVVLSKLLGDKAEIIPVSHVRKVDHPEVMKIIKDLPGVNLEHISSDKDRGDVIYLRFLDQNERVKTMMAFMAPILIDDVKTILDSDIFLFLPVTDFEVTLDSLRFVKEHSKGLVIFDAHGPTKTMTGLGDRLSKFWVDRDLWLPYIDILKMNRKEAKYCWYKKKYSLEELEDDIPLARSELPNFARHCFKFGVKALYITWDVAGCLLYTADQHGEPLETVIPAMHVDDVVDSTGCGDSFAGGLAFGMITTDDYIKAGQYANVMGAQCTQGPGFQCFKSLEETKKMISDTYGEK
ncbi:MAG: carbohydrate kinase family protein [Gammaproteobacteria bacterium]|nr:carbohydrate kinase family protein [Gammaproteobacteria bacterium]